MNDNTSIAITLGILFLSIGGCCVMESKYDSQVCIEREKTKQMEMQLQSKIDSLQINHIKGYEKKN